MQEQDARRVAELELEMDVAEQADESCDAIEQEIKDLVDNLQLKSASKSK